MAVYEIPHFLLKVQHGAATSLSVTRHPEQILLTINGVVIWLSPKQSDLLAQGLLMATIRAGLKDMIFPWDRGHIRAVKPLGDGKPKNDLDDGTTYGHNEHHRFFSLGWFYEGEGEDPDYPANVVFLKTTMDRSIVFEKGKDCFLLSGTQAAQICLDLAAAADSLTTRDWRVWDKQIEWSVEDNSTYQALSDKEEKALRDYLIRYKPKRGRGRYN